MNFPVVLINLFSVPEGKEEEFFVWWDEVKETVIKAPGFISGTLHRSIQAQTRFNFINVAQWENDIYSQAYERRLPSMNARLAQLGVEMTPGLCMVHLEY
jgi:heme oxygenase (mycobilin-producing)